MNTYVYTYILTYIIVSRVELAMVFREIYITVDAFDRELEVCRGKT